MIHSSWTPPELEFKGYATRYATFYWALTAAVGLCVLDRGPLHSAQTRTRGAPAVVLVENEPGPVTFDILEREVNAP
jgi:hypothetical protein